MSPTAAAAPSPSKMTARQAGSLAAMRSCLVCQICDRRMVDPATLLSCAHSFCLNCILKYTENSWVCPLPGCGMSVTMRGDSSQSIKKNHVISSVSSSLENIEQILANGPSHWWVEGREDGGKSVGGENDEEVVDFQQIMDQSTNDKKKDDEGTESGGREKDDDVSSTTVDYLPGQHVQKANAEAVDHRVGRKTLSIDQSLFPSDESNPKHDEKDPPPNFSCSPIAMQSSQPAPPSPMPSNLDDDDDDDGPHTAQTGQTATASQLDNVLLMSGTASQRSTTNQLPSSVRKRQRTSAFTTPSSSDRQNQQPRRTTRVSFQQQPRVILLDPLWTLSSQATRCLRNCTNDGFVKMLKMNTENKDQFDSGFDFETEEGRKLFLTTLSSNRTVQEPPAPMSFYAISTVKDEAFSFGGVITVPRSFPYYLAVACGLSIVDIEFLSSAAKLKKRRGVVGHQRYPFPSLPHAENVARKRSGKSSSQQDYFVNGASNYSWGAPAKARVAALDRHSLWQNGEGSHAVLETLLPGTDLLHGYGVLLLGEFDQSNHSRRNAVARRKKQHETDQNDGYCTRGNVNLLLQLCGARVYDVDTVVTAKHIKKGMTAVQIEEVKNATPLGGRVEGSPTLINAIQSSRAVGGSPNFIVLVKDKSEYKVASEFVNQITTDESCPEIPVVICQWLLDSIGEFEEKKTCDYLAGGTK